MKASITLFFIMLLCVGCHNSGNSTKALLAHIDSLTAKVEIAKADSLFATITPKALKDDDDRAHYFIIKAKLDMVLNRQLDNDSAFNFCIRHYESTGNQKDLAQSYYIKGAAKAMAENLKEALPLIKKAEIIERKAGVPELRYIIYANISYVYSELGAKHTALDYARKALAVADETGDIDNLCSPNRIPTTRANVLSRAARSRRCGGSRCSVLGVRPGNTETGKLVAVYENVSQAGFNNEIYEGFTGFRM